MKKVVVIAVFIFLFAAALYVFGLREIADVESVTDSAAPEVEIDTDSEAYWLPEIGDNEWFYVVSDDQRFPFIPDYINEISYDVKKTESEMALIAEVQALCRELSGKLSDDVLPLFKESQRLWTEYYRKETFGLNPANNFVVIKIDGEVKKLNVYRRNMNIILEGRKAFLTGILNNDFYHEYKDTYDVLLQLIGHSQKRVEYFSEERNRMRVFAGEKAWKSFLNANDQFLKSFFAGDTEKIEENRIYALDERYRILDVQILALEKLRIERED